MMNANRAINDLLAAHKLAWRDVWKATLDLVGGEVIVVLKDGRKVAGPLDGGRSGA